MTKESLVLTGFMGMGKSTVGREAARRLAVNYYDTDDWMEAVEGLDVPRLVKTDMTKFREHEAKALGTILAQEPGVISTGGGIVSTVVGRKALVAADAPVVWLKAPFEDAARRVAQDTGRERPLFSNIDNARALYEERMGWYEETANHIVDAAQPIELVVGEVVEIAKSTRSALADG